MCSIKRKNHNLANPAFKEESMSSKVKLFSSISISVCLNISLSDLAKASCEKLALAAARTASHCIGIVSEGKLKSLVGDSFVIPKALEPLLVQNDEE